MVRSLAGTTLVQIATLLATFAVGVQLARGLGPEGYGVYGLAMAVIAIASIPGEFGLSQLVTRESAGAIVARDWPKFFGVLRWADSVSWRVAGIVALLLVARVFVFAGGPTSALGATILWGVPIVPLFALAKIRAGALQGLHKVVLSQTSTVLFRPALLSLLLLAVVLLLEDRLDASTAMALNSVTAAAALLAAGLALRRNLPAERPDELSLDRTRWLASSIPIAMTGGIRTLQAHMTVLLLGLLAAPAEVGLFRVAASTVTMFVAPMTVMNIVAVPMIARLHAENDRARLQKLVTHAAQAQSGGVLLLSLPMLIAGEPILRFVFGSEFGPSAEPLRLLLLGQLVNSALGPNAALLTMTRHERRVTRAMAIALVVNVATVGSLASTWGMLGAAVGFVASMTTWNVLTWWDARRLVGIDTSLAPVGAPQPQERPAP